MPRDPLFAPPAAPEPRNWKPVAIGLLCIAILVVALLMIFSPAPRSAPLRATGPNQPTAPAAYAANLPLSGEKMSTVNIPATGGQLYYVAGEIKNTGTQTISAATIEIIFRDVLGRICQRDDVPLTVVIATEPALDVTSLGRAPLAPGQSRAFQMPLEHISREWNGQYPELRIIAVNAR